MIFHSTIHILQYRLKALAKHQGKCVTLHGLWKEIFTMQEWTEKSKKIWQTERITAVLNFQINSFTAEWIPWHITVTLHAFLFLFLFLFFLIFNFLITNQN